MSRTLLASLIGGTITVLAFLTSLTLDTTQQPPPSVLDAGVDGGCPGCYPDAP